MSKINILSAELSNKISAGEVVERPASVVKELLENSIDAGSTNIKIIIKEFGIEEIRIIDNGSGISNNDMEKAFMRHATSKIRTDYDLFHIETLGFRGEALASIASVSNIDIKSCASDEQGKRLILEGGKIVKTEYYALIQGTDISVKNLFYNTPARLKYLRNSYTEQANIMNVVNKLALSYPNIAFEVIVDDKILLKTYGDNNIHKIISKIYSLTVAKNMLKFKATSDDYKIDGYVSKPEETRANKNYINIFINGRYIKNYAIQNAITDAYGTFLMKNRFPIAVININMNPILLDVNVHPTKQEIRLSKEYELISLIKDAISERLSENTYIPDGINNVLRNKSKDYSKQLDFSNDLDKEFVAKDSPYLDSIINNISYNQRISDKNVEINTEDKFDNFTDQSYKNYNINFEENTLKVEEKIEDRYLSNIEEKNSKYTKINLPQLSVLVQIFKTYILAQAGENLYLIDQHAAQERYNFEKFQKIFSESKNISKQLLIPITFNFSVEEVANIKNISEKLNSLGLVIEEFGNNSYIVREYPTWIENDAEHIIRSIIDKVSSDKNIDILKLRHDAIAMASCKASIKANQYLTHLEMEKVISDLYSCKNPFTCPHGRPIISKLTKKDLEKMFKRIV
ncbi:MULTISPECIES: DNA mismatch repair endonuclease MutL [unclassified Gemella]|uniref:DNA mismatch repair endonuclease MutL n=1 Tax=unclassified Gemella TaxID=2624949 RepID=UPI001C04532D|nr:MULTISPECIES: DNA mismatch repair endonuclease MutL [unclassified Gemella]MBU0278302.1 DNA mismatch repair endonuclease MutL [Gemella sp. zg-1178]QWQ38192.1 DNA mismatch repair endonuclease MutL [Gemella sp. zg-570]